MRGLVRLIFAIFLFQLSGAFATSFTLNDETPIYFTVSESALRVASHPISESQKSSQVFKDASNAGSPSPYTEYALSTDLKNNSQLRRKISLSHARWMEDVTLTIFRKNGDKEVLDLPISYFNWRSAKNPREVSPNEIPSAYKAFVLLPEEKVKVLVEFTTKAAALRADSFSLNFYHVDEYLEHRRLGLWLEGILVGALLALTVFSWYSFYQSRDITSLYYGLWILAAVSAVLTQWYHDGSRLFEFVFNVEKKKSISNKV